MLELANEIRRLACAAGTTEGRLALEELALRYVAEAAGLNTRAADGDVHGGEHRRRRSASKPPMVHPNTLVSSAARMMPASTATTKITSSRRD
jgi:hypothetical protein